MTGSTYVYRLSMSSFTPVFVTKATVSDIRNYQGVTSVLLLINFLPCSYFWFSPYTLLYFTELHFTVVYCIVLYSFPYYSTVESNVTVLYCSVFWRQLSTAVSAALVSSEQTSSNHGYRALEEQQQGDLSLITISSGRILLSYPDCDHTAVTLSLTIFDCP